jgi:hypothetical protein
MKLTTELYLVPRLYMRGAILHYPYACMAWCFVKHQQQIYFIYGNKVCVLSPCVIPLHIFYENLLLQNKSQFAFNDTTQTRHEKDTTEK